MDPPGLYSLGVPSLQWLVFPLLEVKLIELAGAPSGVGGAVVRHLPPEMLKEKSKAAYPLSFRSAAPQPL